MADGAQLDLFAWSKPLEPKRRRSYTYFTRHDMTCQIGPHHWFGASRCYTDFIEWRNAALPDLRTPISFRGYQFRAEEQIPDPAYFWVIDGKLQERRVA